MATRAEPAAPRKGTTSDLFYVTYDDRRADRLHRPAKGSSAKRAATTVRRNLPELTQLPSRKTPAAVFMGVTTDGKKALMLVSSNVHGRSSATPTA